MLKVCWWLQGRLFQLWHCVRDQTEQIEKIPPPLHILFLFLYFSFIFFALFCDDMGHFLNFFVFFYVYKYWDSRYRKKKEKEESSHRPTTGIFVRMDRRTVCICWFKIYFFLWLAYLKINSWSVWVVYCGCRYVCDRCVCDCQRSPVPPLLSSIARLYQRLAKYRFLSWIGGR